MAAAVLVPVKAFAKAKGRLAEVLDAAGRADLARAMAEAVLRAASPLPVSVVCDDEEVRAWAAGLGVPTIWTPDLGLNGAVEAAIAQVAAAGIDRAVVAHADLPLALDLTWVAEGPGVTLVPDRHGDGTNVIGLPTSVGFRFAYGAASCARHREEAERLGLAVRVVPDVRLGWDVDTPADLELPDLDLLPVPK